MKKLILIPVVFFFVLAGCYNDKTDELYPGVGLFTPCDTTHPVSYSRQIVPLMQNYCYSCHQGTHSSSNYQLDTYATIQPMAPLVWNNVSCTGHAYHQMPPSFKLDSCALKQFDYWINTESAPNN